MGRVCGFCLDSGELLQNHLVARHRHGGADVHVDAVGGHELKRAGGGDAVARRRVHKVEEAAVNVEPVRSREET